MRCKCRLAGAHIDHRMCPFYSIEKEFWTKGSIAILLAKKKSFIVESPLLKIELNEVFVERNGESVSAAGRSREVRKGTSVQYWIWGTHQRHLWLARTRYETWLPSASCTSWQHGWLSLLFRDVQGAAFFKRWEPCSNFCSRFDYAGCCVGVGYEIILYPLLPFQKGDINAY